MTIDLPTLATILGILASAGSGALWLGRIISRGTRAATTLTARLESLEHSLKALTGEMLSRRDFMHYMERLGYKNPTLEMPAVPTKASEESIF